MELALFMLNNTEKQDSREGEAAEGADDGGRGEGKPLLLLCAVGPGFAVGCTALLASSASALHPSAQGRHVPDIAASEATADRKRV